MLAGTLILQSGRAITAVIKGTVLLFINRDRIIIVSLYSQPILFAGIGISSINDPVLFIIL
jgi:hypothetical protein